MIESNTDDRSAHDGGPRLPSSREIEERLAAEGLTIDPKIFDSFYLAYEALWRMLRRLDRSGPLPPSGDEPSGGIRR